MSNNKVKSLLKGLRYISQIFDNEKEPEMQIGFPTNVKHVAHIGWDGPSVNSPSWMNDFKSPPGLSSTSLSLPEDHMIRDDNGRTSARAPNSPAAKGTSELPRSSQRQSSSSSLTIDSVTDSSNKEKSVKPKQSSRRSSKSSIKDPPDGAKLNRVTWLPSDSNQAGSVSPAHSQLPDIPQKARRKKSKEHSLVNGSKKSSRLKPQDSSDPETYQSPFSDPAPGSNQSTSTSNNNELYSQPYQDEAHEKGLNGVY